MRAPLSDRHYLDHASTSFLRPEAARYDGPAEHLQDVWIAVRASLRSVLERVNLDDVVQGHLPRSVAKLTEDPDAWAPPRAR